MNDSRNELLHRMPVFGATSAQTLSFILQRARDFALSEGEFFFRRGDEAQSFFVLEHGRVAVLREHEGSDYCLSELGPGDCFGEMSLIECRNRNAAVRALVDCTAIEIPHATLHELYRHDVNQYLLIQMNIAREISRRLHEADRRLFEFMVAASDDAPDYWWSVV